MFGRKRRGAPTTLLTVELMQLIVTASVETAAKNEAAAERWGIGTADRWSADLAAGTISFHFPDHTITGPVEAIGSYGTASGTWMWGWANETIPASVLAASRQTQAYGEAHGLEALTSAKLEIPAESGDDFAAITVELAGLSGFYRAPTANGFTYLGFSDFS